MSGQMEIPNTRLPDFLLVGAAKSATSSLHFYLDQHPQIKMASQKESWFFSFYKNPPDYDSPGKLCNIISELDSYLSLFDGAKENQKLGDACPSYLYTHADTIKNIRLLYSEEELAKLKIIISLREPVSRAFSQYYTFKRKVQEPLDFEHAILESTVSRRLKHNWNIFYDYLGFGMYSDQVKAFQEAFGKDRVLVVLYDDIRNDVNSVCSSIFTFLGIDNDLNIDDAVMHNSITGEPVVKWLVAGLLSQNAVKRTLASIMPKKLRMVILYLIVKPLIKRKSLDPDIHRKLSAYFEEDILALEELIARDLSGWRKST
jgi:hypothetical protein